MDEVAPPLNTARAGLDSDAWGVVLPMAFVLGILNANNRSRQEINERIHRELQSNGRAENQEHPIAVLVPRQEMTGADRQWAAQYEPGDIVRYARGSKAVGAGEYVRVTSIDREQNLLTVERDNG